MSSKFFGNSKVKSTQGEKNKKVVTPKSFEKNNCCKKNRKREIKIYPFNTLYYWLTTQNGYLCEKLSS